MPTSTTTPQHSKEAKTEKSGLEGASKESVEKSGSGSGIISYLFGGQSKNKKSEDEAPGMYLDDLIEKQNDDEEMLKIYLGSRSRNETISGRVAFFSTFWFFANFWHRQIMLETKG